MGDLHIRLVSKVAFVIEKIVYSDDPEKQKDVADKQVVTVVDTSTKSNKSGTMTPNLDSGVNMDRLKLNIWENQKKIFSYYDTEDC